jgi:cytosine/adenosine deaminase-related metal-dependent hydrolase
LLGDTDWGSKKYGNIPLWRRGKLIFAGVRFYEYCDAESALPQPTSPQREQGLFRPLASSLLALRTDASRTPTNFMSTPSEPLTLRARWVFPADEVPIADGLITIAGDFIKAVEPAGSRTPDVDLGNVAILPGLVNAHTHLDLSDARGKMPPSPDFTGWLRRVIEHRRGQTPEQVDAAISYGVGELLRCGTTLVGDIASEGKSWRFMTNVALHSVVFHELLGLTKERARAALKSTSWSDPTVGGLSPHAPYSFRAECLSMVASRKVPLAIHLAESAAEVQLIDRRSGPFVPFLNERGVWDPTGLPWSFESVIESTRGAPQVLYIHANHLRPETAIPPNGTIVYCPRTHAAFGHPPHPFRDFLKRGVRVALGTDSLASNPDLEILAEARFVAARHPDLAGETLLRMLTLSGAEALGWADVAGSLTPGKSADLVVLPLPNREETDPYRLVFDSSLAVERVMFRGSWVQGPVS